VSEYVNDPPSSSGGGISTVSTGLTLSAGALTANLSVGVAGGQTVIGGAAASETLTLSSTSHATKGQIRLGNANNYFDEAAGNMVLSGSGVSSITSTSTTGPVLTLSGASSMSPPSATAGQLRLNQTGSDHPGMMFTKGATVGGAIRVSVGGQNEYYGDKHVFFSTPIGGVQLMVANPGSSAAVGIPYGSGQTALLLNRAGSGTRQDILRTVDTGTGATTLGIGTSNNNGMVLVSNNTTRMEFTGDAKIGMFGVTAVVQQTSGANLTNNVTAGGTDDTIADYSSLTVYASDAAAIRNNLYQLARKTKVVHDAMRAYGWLT
jgi:hypothetical protein